ncbi:M protein, serotype 2.1 like [Quillaja saponaria]|uniref:M protein, serotype 2.1 like n=1 Tax=Quillaja saponaria TaxID=32244 RepID=A0AAD7L239_QUISA|nr:M protein, serotype 2.1 like [Quillaja saponaria]
MAVAAFKSSSRRGNLPSSSATISSGRESADVSPQKAPLRRSRSVSAFSRTNLDIPSEFLNKRDNPLFSSTGSSLDNEIESEKVVGIAKSNEIGSKFSSTKTKVAVSDGGDGSRGRSASRNAEVVSKGSVSRKEIGRSLSRLDNGPRTRSRSVSKAPASRQHYVNSESEAQQEFKLKKYTKGCNLSLTGNTKKGSLSRSISDCKLDQMESMSSRQSPFGPSDGSGTILSCLQTPNWEDEVSTASSLSGSEERVIRAVCEQMKSVQVDNLEGGATTSGIYETVRSEVRRAISDIQNDLESAIRSNATAIAAATVADIPPDLVNPGAAELVLDIRREYAKKLEQSQERARKLQVELAAEEHHGQELDRILKEVVPDPKTHNAPKSRPTRKASIERRKMSKRLTEEAMAYFDECVSLSTFDSSDFSSQEDPPFNLVIPTPVGNNVSFPEAISSASTTNCTSSGLYDKQELDIQCSFMTGSGPTSFSDTMGSNYDQVTSNSDGTEGVKKFQFSLAQKQKKISDFQQDIQKYIRHYDEDASDLPIIKTKHYDLDQYKYYTSAQNFLFDRVYLKNRIESGSLLLCGGGSAFSLHHLSSVI